MIKRFLSVFLAACMALALLPGTARAAAEVDSGECGANGGNLTWTLDDDGLLTISGSGAMADYKANNAAPWSANRYAISRVVLSAGVTSIGSSAFSSCSYLTGVTIPEGVTSIGDYAFSYCSSLTGVTIPKGVASIGNLAFSHCTNLTSVTIPEGVTSIGASAFSSCTGLTGITIPKSVTFIGDYAFSYCSGLTGVTIPEGVSSIGNSTFLNCTNLTSVTIPEGVTSIGNSAFSICTGLTSISLPEGVTSIGASAFSFCTGLTSITIPRGVTSIEPSVFFGCTGLTSVTIPESLTSIREQAFTQCTSLTGITLPEGVISIGSYAFGRCTSLTDLTIPSSVTSICASTFEETPWLEKQSDPVIINGMFVCCKSSAPTVVIPDGVTAIAGEAFCWNVDGSQLTRVAIPESVTSIGGAAFVYPCEYMGGGNCNPYKPVSSNLVICYNGNPDQWAAVEKLPGTGYCSVHPEIPAILSPVCFIPTLACGAAAIAPGAADPVVTVASDMAFREDVDTSAIEITANTTGLELASVSLSSAARSGDNKTLALQFTGTAQAGGRLDLTVKAEAFADSVADINGPVDTALPSITVADTGNPPPDGPDPDGPPPVEPVDPEPEKPEPPEEEPEPEKPAPEEPEKPEPPEEPVEPDPAPGPAFPAPAPNPAPAPDPGPAPEKAGPTVVAVEPTVDLHDPEPVVISGEGESEFQHIVKSGGYERWIDRVELPEYALDLYKVLCIGGDNDALYDLLISDGYYTVSGGSGAASGEEADVESVLELTADLNLPYSSGSGIFTEGQFSDGFDVIDTTAGDRAIRYGELKEGDVVRTSAYNGIFVTSVPKDGNDSYDADLKAAAAYASTAFQAFDRDHPEVFWLSGKSKLRLVTATMKDGSQKYKETYIFFILADKDGFTVRDSKYPSQSSIESDIQRLETAVTTILSTVTASTPNEQAAQLNRWLTEHNEYNRSEDLHALPNWPHECLSALVGSTGTEGPVCDGYSRAFKVLCDRLEIPCVLVDGYAKVSADSAGEFHMWNSARMPDGQWYGVDVTWNDPTVKGVTGAKSGHEREDFLLVGADTVVMGLKFSVSHPPKNRAADGGVAFVNGPTLSTAAFNPLAAATVLPFTDVAASSWYLSAVKYVYENDLMTGESASAFAPGGAMTRAMVWTVLGRMDGASVNGGDPWYSAAQSWATGAEVSDGAAPNGRISREELVTMLWRTQGSPDAAADLSGFTDGGTVSGWASGAVQWAVSTGLLEGSAGKLDPSGSATRAEVAAILMRFCQTLQK